MVARVLSVEQQIQRLAGRRQGIVARAALRAAGLSDDVIDGRIASGFLIPVHRGVFAVGRADLTIRGRWWAAIEAGGAGATLSHASAGALHGVFSSGPPRAVIDVSVPARRRAVPGIAWHATPLHPRSQTVRDGIPCVTVARALVGIAAQHGREATERAWSSAASARSLLPRDIAFEIEHGRGRAGIALVARLFAEYDGYLGQRTRSDLERDALRLLRRHRVERPDSNLQVRIEAHVFDGDLVWPSRRLIAEVDGRSVHEHVIAFDADRKRDAVLGLAGWRVTRLTWNDVHRRPGLTVDRIRALLEQQPLTAAPGRSAARFLRRSA